MVANDSCHSDQTRVNGSSFALLILGAFAQLLLVVACQSTISLEEARKITAEFQGESFVPPPRTISDITAILVQEKRSDLESLEKAKAVADQPPPKTDDASVLANFFLRRGQAAHELGRAQQEIEDYRQAVLFAEKSGSTDLTMNLFHLGRAEGRGGKISRALDIFRRCTNQPIRLNSWHRACYGQLADYFALAGDLDSAEDALSTLRGLYGRLQSIPNVPRWVIQASAASLARVQALVLDSRGLYSEAEGVFRQAIVHSASYKTWPSADPKGWDTFAHYLVAELSLNLRDQGRLVEAENEARKALVGALRSHGRYSAVTASMISRFTFLLFAQGRFSEAEMLARANLNIYRKVGASPDSFSFAWARSALADSLVAQERWPEALKEYDAIQKDMASDPAAYEKMLKGNLNQALALVMAGRADEALETAQATMERNTRLLGEEHYNTAEARGFLGMAYAAKGEHQRALAEFRKAIPILLSHPGRVDQEGTTARWQNQRVQLILESYIDLLEKIRGTNLERDTGLDATAESFRIADVGRGQSIQRALAASSARAAAKDPKLADLVRKEQDAQKQVNALYSLLANALSQPTREQNPKAIESLRSKISQLQAARTSLKQEIDRGFPAYAQLMNPKPTTVGQVRSVLRPGEALVSTYSGLERTFVWAIPQKGRVAFSAASLGKEQVEAAVAELRKALNPNAQTLGDIPPFNLTLAHKLYQSLLAPVEPGWGEAKSLLVVAHGALGQLPFSVLPTEAMALGPEKEPLFSNYRSVPWLARRMAVTALPSVASLVTLRGLPPGNPGRRPFIGFGDPYFNQAQAKEAAKPAGGSRSAVLASRGLLQTRGLRLRLRSSPKLEGLDSSQLSQLPRLPDTADEVQGIAVAMKADLTKDVFLGLRANEEAVKEQNLSGHRVIVFATHGLVPGDLNGLTQPALALSSPKVAGVGGDGLLTMEEILGLRLDADWVVLSACNTASGQGAGAEAVSGLGRAFFYAGARALLVSNWPVETTSARRLTTDLFRRQAENRKLSRAEALRQAMLGLIDGKGYQTEGKTVFSYAHPIFWAPFTIVGDGGGAEATPTN